MSSVGLVHDYLLVMRGAERTFAAIASCWPDAPIYTLLYDRDGTERRFARRDVRTSYLQRSGVRQAGFRRLLAVLSARGGKAAGARTRSDHLEQQRVRARRSSTRRRRRTSPTATRPSATSGTSTRVRSKRRRDFCGRFFERMLLAHPRVGPGGLAPRVALHRELGADEGARSTASTAERQASFTLRWRSTASRSALRRTSSSS